MKHIKLTLTPDDFDIIQEALREYAIVCAQAAEFGPNYKIDKQSHMWKLAKRIDRVKNKIEKQRDK